MRHHRMSAETKGLAAVFALRDAMRHLSSPSETTARMSA
jgi:hypothetical protein